MSLLRRLLDMAAPPVCRLCRRRLVRGEEIICARCDAAVYGGVGFAPGQFTELRDRLPRTVPVAVTAAMAVYRPDAPVARLIKRGKYGDSPAIIRSMARRMAERLAVSGALDDVDVLQPVPMHIVKRLARGYNQAAIIARELSRVGGIPVVDAAVMRRPHSAQARHSGAQRAANVAGIFAVSRPGLLVGRHVALVDDIITTGATLSELAAVVTEAGARAVSIFTLAAATR